MNSRDIRSENPDVGLLNAGRPFKFIIDYGKSLKSFMDGVTAGLPDPDVVSSKLEVQREHLPQQPPLGYLLWWPILDPLYVMSVQSGDLAIRTHKESPSGNWTANWRAKIRLKQESVYGTLVWLGLSESNLNERKKPFV